MIIDEDRNGNVDKNELNRFFSFVPPEALQQGNATPMFPVNNKNALDKFRGGKWAHLEFDGFAQLCERFPYISYPVLHVQHVFRERLLGNKFWEKLDDDRMKVNMKERIFAVRTADGKGWRPIERPGRCTMKEILEYSRRKTTVQNGKRVGKPAKVETLVSSEITKLRDEQLSRMPLMNMIRNCRCMYYVPAKPPERLGATKSATAKSGFTMRPELELEGFDADAPISAAVPLSGTVVEAPEGEAGGEDDDDEWETDTSASDYEADDTGGGTKPPPMIANRVVLGVSDP